LVNQLTEQYGVDEFEQQAVNWKDFTLIARRREMADILRLQIYGVMWAAAGIDQDYPAEFTPALRDFESDDGFYDFQPNHLQEDRLALGVIQQAVSTNPEIQFMLVNEPILIAEGENSDIRYNYYYPRWAYDQYRGLMQSYLDKLGINYNDLWDIVPQENFTNSAIHMDRAGEEILAERIASILKETTQK
jgi:hypothetical protein